MGNICRSPIGEGLLKHHAKRANFSIHIDSAGTSGWHRGNPPDERSIEVMKDHGHDIKDQRSRPLTPDDLHTFDFVLVMDDQNLRDVEAMGPARALVRKFVPHQNVPDPYYGGPEGFETVYRMMNQAAEAWIHQWTHETQS